MKTLPLVDSNMVSYSFIAALPLSLEEIIYLKTQRPLWDLPEPMLCAPPGLAAGQERSFRPSR